MNHPRKTYWAEKARAKMKRWVTETGAGSLLAARGVPLNLMTPDQRAHADREYPVGAKVRLP